MCCVEEGLIDVALVCWLFSYLFNCINNIIIKALEGKGPTITEVTRRILSVPFWDIQFLKNAIQIGVDINYVDEVTPLMAL